MQMKRDPIPTCTGWRTRAAQKFHLYPDSPVKTLLFVTEYRRQGV